MPELKWVAGYADHALVAMVVCGDPRRICTSNGKSGFLDLTRFLEREPVPAYDSKTLWPTSDVLAAVDMDLGAVHIGRCLRAQHIDDLRHFIRCAEAMHRDLLLDDLVRAG